MSTYRFDKLFKPRSVAVIGASIGERSLGRGRHDQGACYVHLPMRA
jgi:hypothetical protein